VQPLTSRLASFIPPTMLRETLTTTEYAYTVVFEPDPEAGGYVVTCPALSGLVTEGDTLEEARAMTADAIRAWLESLREDGLPDRR
jgi:predicted RNase H-like HicB family nuclease